LFDLPTDLRNQARFLAEHDGTKPKQVNLRRAISSAYYALFHLLINESMIRLYPRHPQKGKKLLDEGPLMDRISRSYQHTDMRKICVQFQQKPLPDTLKLLLPSGVSPELQTVAKAFVELQEERHAADYDVGKKYSREVAIGAVATAERAFQEWERVPEREANVFVAALAFGARWSK